MTLIKAWIATVVLGALAAGSAMAGDIDFAVTDVKLRAGDPGLANVTAEIAIVAQDTVPGTSTGVALSLDGSEFGRVPIVTLPYVAIGCTYYENWQGMGPACVDEPGCDLYTVNGQEIPGHCFLVILWWGPWPIACACSHTIYVTWEGVSLDGVGILEVMADVDEAVSEPNENNNTLTVFGPVATQESSWGMIKALYR